MDGYKSKLDQPLSAACARQLVSELTPLIRVRALRALQRCQPRARECRDAHQDVDELAQEVLAAIFANDGQTLRSWDSERGKSFRNFVAMVADREIRKILCSSTRRPWIEAESASDELGMELGSAASPEQLVAAYSVFEHLSAALRAELSPRGSELFQLLVIDDCSVDEVCERMQLGRDVVYAWRSRLLKRLRVIVKCMNEDTARI